MSKKNCKFCGKLLTKENEYGRHCCTDSTCKRKLLKVCDESCEQCPYDDCRADPNLFGKEKVSKTVRFGKIY